VGLDEIVSQQQQQRNMERLKRDLRSCFPLLDRILAAPLLPFMADLTGAADCVAFPDASQLQVRTVTSSYGESFFITRQSGNDGSYIVLQMSYLKFLDSALLDFGYLFAG